MKTVFIIYNQTLTERVEYILRKHNVRGYTKWENVQGQGTDKGDPHLGTHTWPSMNSSMLCVLNDEKVSPLLDTLKKLNEKTEDQGLRVFVWNIEASV